MKYLKFWFPVFLYSVIIFGVSSIPNIQGPAGNIPWDKLVHVLEYMPFGFLLTRAIRRTQPSFSGPILIIVAFLSFLYGMSDEYHQIFIPGRDAALGDIIADTIGGALGGALYRI